MIHSCLGCLHKALRRYHVRFMSRPSEGREGKEGAVRQVEGGGSAVGEAEGRAGAGRQVDTKARLSSTIADGSDARRVGANISSAARSALGSWVAALAPGSVGTRRAALGACAAFFPNAQWADFEEDVEENVEEDVEEPTPRPSSSTTSITDRRDEFVAPMGGRAGLAAGSPAEDRRDGSVEAACPPASPASPPAAAPPIAAPLPTVGGSGALVSPLSSPSSSSVSSFPYSTSGDTLRPF